MDNRPIGVFDSGLGGLTAVRELSRVLPAESIVYFGDTGRVPYGTRGADIILRYAQQDIAFLKTRNVKMLVAACGTISSVAREAGENAGLPYTGVLEPTAAAAAKATKNGKIGVIATHATIKSDAYHNELRKLDREIEVFGIACPLLVPLVENGFISPDEPITRLATERYLRWFAGKGIDTLILGCTHYPLIREIIGQVIQDVMGASVLLIDSGQEVALHSARMLKEQNLLCDAQGAASHDFFVSDDVSGFYDMAGMCLPEAIQPEIREVRYVDISRY